MTDTRMIDTTATPRDLSVLRRLDGSLLLVLRELLRTGNASEAAHRLALSQSAVSHALGRLRVLFDDPLFLRRPHGLAPTRRAQELGPRVDALLALASEVLGGDDAFDPATAQREFRLSAPEFVAVTLGAPLIRSVSALAPACTVRIEHLDNVEALRRLRRGDLDIALGRFESDLANPAMEREILYEDEYCLAARRGHPRIGRRVGAKRYVELLHIFAEAESEVSSRDRSTAGEHLRMCLVPRWLAALVTVAATDGVATCPRRLAVSQAGVLGLQVRALPFATHPIEVSLLRLRGEADAGAAWFVDQVRATIQDRPASPGAKPGAGAPPLRR